MLPNVFYKPLLYFTLFQIFCLSSHTSAQRLPLNPEKLKYAKEVEATALNNKDSLMLAEAYYLYGKLYVFSGDPATSQRYFLKSQAILEPRGDSYELGRIYCRLAENPKLLDSRQAQRYVQSAISIFQRIGSLKGLVTAYGLLGQLYDTRGRSEKSKALRDSAFVSFTKVELLGKRLKDTLAMAEANMHMAEFYGNENPASIPVLRNAVHYFGVKKSKRSMIVARTNLGEAYIEAGQLQKGYDEVNQAQRLYAEAGMADMALKVGFDKVLIKYFERTSQWKQALSQYKEMFRKESDQFQKDRHEAVLRLQTQYETGKKDALLNVQKQELGLSRKLVETQRRFIVLTTLLSVLATGLSILFFRALRLNRRTSQRNEQLVREQNHRVKNNLQMISSLLNMQARLLSDSTARSAINESRLRVQSMAIIQRKLYDRKEFTDIDMSEFIPELTEAALSACGFGTIQPEYQIIPLHLDVDRTVSVGLILTELIINACKYAFPENAQPALYIGCEEEDREIILTVKDNGPGIQASDKDDTGEQLISKGSKFGMQLLDLQTRQLYGQYRFQHENGLVFTLKFKK